jgi:hypothetical protein
MGFLVGSKPKGVTQTGQLQQTQQTPQTSKAQPPATTGDAGAAQPANWGAKPAQGRPADPVADKLVQIADLVKGHTDGAAQKKILDIFAKASPEELNGIIQRMPEHDMHEMLDDMDDHRFLGIKLGAQNHTAMLNLLSKTRLGDLDNDSRAKVIATMQYHYTDHGEEGAIRDIFLGTKGTDLTDLKNKVDEQGDYHDLHQLLWHDIGDPKIRGQILDQFKKEAVPTGQSKILSDIDDTYYAHYKDHGVPWKTVYPGVQQLYAEIDKGADNKSPDRQGDLQFLSARPYDRAGIQEDATLKMMHGNAGTGADENVTMAKATMTSGDLLHLIGNEEIAEKKFDNWKQERQLFPEYSTVLFGDSGQGDAIFGTNAIADKANGADVKSLMIHNVTDMSDADKAMWAKKGAFVFDTYVGAATHAYEQGLISKEGLQRVAGSAMKDFNNIQWDSDEQKQKQQALMQKDMAAMQAAIAAGQ